MRLLFWWLLFLFFSFGVTERTLVFIQDSTIVGTELNQYLIICLCLIFLSFLYPNN